jgi:hypothetical protein
MPQPYLPHFKSKRYSVGPNFIGQRPKLAGAITACMSLWAYVDNELGGLFGILLGTSSPAAYNVFLALRRWSNQRDALNGAASAVLTADELVVYNGLIREYGRLETDRNTLGHGCYGVCPEDEDLLLLIKVEQHVMWQADILPRLQAGEMLPAPNQGLEERLVVYSLNEIERIRDQMEKVWWGFFHFNGYLRDRANSNRIKEFQALLASPMIQ